MIVLNKFVVIFQNIKLRGDDRDFNGDFWYFL